MTDKICPLLKTKCIKKECEWFIGNSFDGACAAVTLANKIKLVTNENW